MTLVSFFQDIQALVLSVIHFKSFKKDLGPVHMNTSVCQLIYTFQPWRRNKRKKGDDDTNLLPWTIESSSMLWQHHKIYVHFINIGHIYIILYQQLISLSVAWSASLKSKPALKPREEKDTNHFMRAENQLLLSRVTMALILKIFLYHLKAYLKLQEESSKKTQKLSL